MTATHQAHSVDAPDSRSGAASPPTVDTPVLTVIIPVYNEAATLDQVLRRVAAAPYPKQVIVVDDGSTDGSRELLKCWEGQGVEVFSHSSNRGKGAAIRTGLEHARGAFTIIQDADLESALSEDIWP